MTKEKNKEKENSLTQLPENNQETKKIVLTADFGKVYCRVRNGKLLRLVRAKMCLQERAGHIYKIKKEYAITSSGYVHLNKVASINIVTPQKVVVDDQEWPNPKIERHSRTKAIEAVNIRKIGIGLSPAGNITVIDKTLFYNIYTYFIQAIQAKMKRVEWDSGKPTDKKIHPNCAQIGTEQDKPKKEGSWAFFETTSPLGLWVNYEDPAIIDCLEEHTQRQRFGDRIAQTIVERNILKDHPAIGMSRVEPQEGGKEGSKKAYVDIYGYRHDFGPHNISDILEQAERGSKAIKVEAEVIEDVPVEEEEAVIEEMAEEEKAGKNKKTPAEMTDPAEDPSFELKQEETKDGEK